MNFTPRDRKDPTRGKVPELSTRVRSPSPLDAIWVSLRVNDNRCSYVWNLWNHLF